MDSNLDFIVSGDCKAVVFIYNIADGSIVRVKQADQHQDVQVRVKKKSKFR